MKLSLSPFVIAALSVSRIDGFTTRSRAVTFAPSVSSSTNISPKNSGLAANILATPVEYDGGQVETQEEQDKIEKVKKRERVPTGPKLRRTMKEMRSHRKHTDNTELFNILKDIVLKNTLKFNSVNLEKDITFTDDVDDCLWFEVKDDFSKDVQLHIASYFLRTAPQLKIDNTELMTQEDYDELTADFIDPGQNQMLCDSPEDCFKKNSNAFCKPNGDGTSTCNLNYLKKYQVKKGTKFRYSGLAIVKDGHIIEVSGVKEGEDQFVSEKAVFLNAFAVHLVLVCHAGMGHLSLYQNNLMKLTTDRSDEYKDLWETNLGPKLLMKALTPEGTNEVNTNIQLLIGPNNSLVGRATSLTNDSITLLNMDMYDKHTAMSPDGIIADIGGDGAPEWDEACKRAWTASKKMVHEICADIKDSDALEAGDLESLALLAWTGMFYHGFIGDFQLDNVNKGNLPFLITGEPHIQTKAYGTLSTVIGVSTMTRTMNAKTLQTYFPKQGQKDAYKNYLVELNECRQLSGIEGWANDGPIYNAIDF